MKRAYIITLVVILVLNALLFGFRYGKGYYPLPMGIKKLHYAYRVGQDKPIAGQDNIIDNNFHFYEKDYSATKEIRNSCALPHILFLALKGVNEQLSWNYNFEGKLNIRIYRKDKLIYTAVTNKISNNYDYDTNGKPSKLYAFELIETPFPLKGGPYKDIKIQVTVIEIDSELSNYVDSAVLSLVPNVRL